MLLIVLAHKQQSLLFHNSLVRTNLWLMDIRLMENLLDTVAIEFGLKEKKEITDDTEKGESVQAQREGHV